jgi:hypothetical protein
MLITKLNDSPTVANIYSFASKSKKIQINKIGQDKAIRVGICDKTGIDTASNDALLREYVCCE